MTLSEFSEMKKDVQMLSTFVARIEMSRKAIEKIDSLSESQKTNGALGELFQTITPPPCDYSALIDEYFKMKKTLLKNFKAEQTEKLKKFHWKLTIKEND